MGPGQLKQCPRCGTLAPLDAKVCLGVGCGHQFRTQFATTDPTQISQSPWPPDQTQPVQSPYQTPPPYQPPPSYRSPYEAQNQQPYPPPGYPRAYYRQTSKEKVPAGLLAIFLGPFGAHLFYLGQTGAAIAMLVGTLMTCGYGALITGPLSLVQGILYLCATDADFERKYVFEKRFF